MNRESGPARTSVLIESPELSIWRVPRLHSDLQKTYLLPVGLTGLAKLSFGASGVLNMVQGRTVCMLTANSSLPGERVLLEVDNSGD